MEPFISFCKYFIDILRRIPSDAWSFLDIPGVIFGVLVWAATCFILWRHGKKEEMRKLLNVTKTGFQATLIACGLFFLFFLFGYSPYKQHQQLAEQHSELQKEKSALLTQIQAKDEELERIKAGKAISKPSLCKDPLRYSVKKVRSTRPEYPYEKEITIYPSKSPVYSLRIYGNEYLSFGSLKSHDFGSLSGGGFTGSVHYSNVSSNKSSSPLPMPLVVSAAPGAQIECIEKLF